MPEYKDAPKVLTPDEFKELWGKKLEDIFIYIISNDTVDLEKSSVERRDGKVFISLELDPDIASYNYKLQMKSLSELSTLPTFEFLRQTYVFDSDMTILHSTIDEKYVATMSGINATVNNYLDYYYHSNEYLKIPEIDEILDYSVEGEETYE